MLTFSLQIFENYLYSVEAESRVYIVFLKKFCIVKLWPELESRIRIKLITFPFTGLIVAFSLSMIPEFRQVAITPFDVTFRENKVEETIRLARLEVAPEANEALLQAWIILIIGGRGPLGGCFRWTVRSTYRIHILFRLSRPISYKDTFLPVPYII